MIRVTLLTLFLVQTSFCQAASFAEIKWKTYRSEKGDFSVRLPGPPKIMQTRTGKVFQVFTTTESCLVSVIQTQRIPLSRNRELIKYRDFMLRGYRGKLLDDSSIRWNQHYGRRYSFVYSRQGLPFKKIDYVHVILVEDTWYYFVYSTMNFGGNLDYTNRRASKMSRRMFESFTLKNLVKSTAKTEAESLPGSWVVESAVENGRRDKKVEGTEYSFRNGRFHVLTKNDLKNGDMAFVRGEFTTDVTKTPNHLNLKHTYIKKNLFEVPAIFKIVGDRLHICALLSGNVKMSRPTKFSAGKDSGYKYYILRRPGK